MPGNFRRAELRGSDELFRPTRPDEDKDRGVSPAARAAADARRSVSASVSVPEVTPAAARPGGHLVRLSDEELAVLADAVQHLKYPSSKSTNKPPMDVFESLEELRQKLLDAAQ